MANRTVKDANSVKGTNPQYLIEKITRTRIYESRYWKEECFALSAELLVDKAMELKSIGGVFGGNVKPTPFLCLVLKMLQIQPDKDIVIEFIKNEDFKYVRALGALYMRIVGTSLDCFKYLEPLYLDYRKLRRMNTMGTYEVIHIDEFIDELLREERSCDVILPRIQKRQVLEETNQLETRISALDDDLEEMEEEEDVDHREAGKVTAAENSGGFMEWDRPHRSPSPRYRRNSSHSPHRRRGGSRDRDRERAERENRDRDRDRDRDRHRSDRDRTDRGRDRDRSRRSRSREKHRSAGHKHKRNGDDDRHKHHKSKKNRHDDRDRDDRRRGGGSKGGGSKESMEIQHANELRAKLGLAPLRP